MFYKKLVAVALFMCTGLVYAFAPQAGTWVVTSEVDGKPGRGLAIDVQNTTLVMQMYAYESNGQPTFYLAVGNVVDNKVTAPLTQYTGGRYFDINDNEVSDPALDYPSRRLGCCHARFGKNNPLPFGGFPRVQRVSQ